MKIFCIGFHKTGTSSMRLALTRLGFRVTGPYGVHDPDIASHALDLARDLVPQYDAFQDNPWPMLYRELDALYPGSRFILTLREPESWIESVTRHFSGRHTPMREWIYGFGDPAGHEREYLHRYLQHNGEVMQHFHGREDKDFLVLRVTDGEGWDVLCPFLDVPTMNDDCDPFPHRNSAGEREARRRPFRRMRRAIGRAGLGVVSSAKRDS
ncbi:MAG: sulfotransferase family protein [Candidatus Binatia bacterium]